MSEWRYSQKLHIVTGREAIALGYKACSDL